jgi:hypothetical protein
MASQARSFTQMWLLNTSIISAGPCLPSHPHGRVAPQTRRSAPQPAGGQAHSERPGATPNHAPAENAIALVSSGVPAALSEIRRLGRTLKRRAVDVLAYFERPGTSNGPTEALNGRLEHLRGSALGFRNLTHYIARSLLETGGFRPQLHPGLR